MAKHRGWTAFVTHDSHHDPRGGAAIFITNSSENIKLPTNTTPAIALEGRAISIGCCIKGVKTTLTSIYLHADPEKRGQQIKDLEDSKFLTRNSIIGGDFNCVENTKIDVQYPPGVSTTYPNAHPAPLRKLLASINQTDLLYRLANGDQSNPEGTHNSRRDPCGTPHLIVNGLLYCPAILTRRVGPTKIETSPDVEHIDGGINLDIVVVAREPSRKKKNQTRIRKEFKTGSSHVATRLYTTSRPFLPLLGDYSRRCEGFKLADEMRNLRLELGDQVGTSSGKLILGLPDVVGLAARRLALLSLSKNCAVVALACIHGRAWPCVSGGNCA
eukprot:scaffold19985_cov115-Isochrysis_galbana.AAC.11